MPDMNPKKTPMPSQALYVFIQHHLKSQNQKHRRPDPAGKGYVRVQNFFFKYRSKPDLSAVPHRRHRAERQHLSGYGRIVKAKHHFSGCFSGPDMRQKFF